MAVRAKQVYVPFIQPRRIYGRRYKYILLLPLYKKYAIIKRGFIRSLCVRRRGAGRRLLPKRGEAAVHGAVLPLVLCSRMTPGEQIITSASDISRKHGEPVSCAFEHIRHVEQEMRCKCGMNIELHFSCAENTLLRSSDSGCTAQQSPLYGLSGRSAFCAAVDTFIN